MNKITESQIKHAIDSISLEEFCDRDRVSESLKKYASEEDPTKIDLEGQLLSTLDLSASFTKELVYSTLCKLLITDDTDSAKSE